MRRLDYLAISFFSLSLAFSVWGLWRMQTNIEDVLQWLPDRSPARTDYQFFEQNFGSDDILIVTWDGCTLNDPRLTNFAQTLRAIDSTHLIQSVVTGVDVAGRLRSQLRITEQEIASRLQGVFFGVERPELTCAVIELSGLGTANRGQAMHLFWEAIDSVPNLPREQVVVGGYPFIAASIDGQLKNSFRYLLVPSMLLATLVALCCLRHVILTLIVFVTSLAAAAMSMAVVPISGHKFGGLMSIIPALVFVLTTSGCIHLIRYSLSGLGDPAKLLAIGWKPCAISTATTAVGMFSLTISEFPAIRHFGLFCGVGVGFSLAFQLILVPWLLHRVGGSGIRRLANRQSDSGRWLKLLDWISSQRWSLSGISALLMIAGLIGVCYLHAEVEVENLFRGDSPILESIAQLERRLGPLDQTEVLLVFPNATTESFPDRVNQVHNVQQALTSLPQIEFAHSLINYLPVEPQVSNALSFVKRSTYRSILRRERANFDNQGLLVVAADREIWRISLRFPFTRHHDFDQIAADVERVFQATLNPASADETGLLPQLIYTGKTHLFQHAQLTLLHDLFLNFLLAFAIITPMLIIVLRSVGLGLIAMLPNLFPTLIVFGGFGWFGIPVDLAIAMTASVALGIAVDDTTHFLVRFCDLGGSLVNVTEPIQKSFELCGPAMLHTTLIGCAGLILYYFGDMKVVSQFALVISTLLMLAVLADLIMLPAILWLFAPPKRKCLTILPLEHGPFPAQITKSRFVD